MSSLAPPRIEMMPDRRIIGPIRRYTMETLGHIPAQWAELDAAGLSLPGAVPDHWYGVCAHFGPDMSFDYLCGQEVPAGAPPAGWATITLPAGRWAVFCESGHISRMRAVWHEIFRLWIGGPGLTLREGPQVEHFPASFDGRTGEGGFQIWLPVE